MLPTNHGKIPSEDLYNQSNNEILNQNHVHFCVHQVNEYFKWIHEMKEFNIYEENTNPI